MAFAPQVLRKMPEMTDTRLCSGAPGKSLWNNQAVGEQGKEKGGERGGWKNLENDGRCYSYPYVAAVLAGTLGTLGDPH